MVRRLLLATLATPKGAERRDINPINKYKRMPIIIIIIIADG